MGNLWLIWCQKFPLCRPRWGWSWSVPSPDAFLSRLCRGMQCGVPGYYTMGVWRRWGQESNPTVSPKSHSGRLARVKLLRSRKDFIGEKPGPVGKSIQIEWGVLIPSLQAYLGWIPNMAYCLAFTVWLWSKWRKWPQEVDERGSRPIFSAISAWLALSWLTGCPIPSSSKTFQRGQGWLFLVSIISIWKLLRNNSLV